MTYPDEGRTEIRMRVRSDGNETYVHELTAAEVIDDHMHYGYIVEPGCSYPDGEEVLRWLAKAGYVVTHPEDVAS